MNHSDERQRTRPDISAMPDAAAAASPAKRPASLPLEDEELSHESFRAIMSSHRRAGRWEPADDIQVQAIFGEVTLDFTRAELPPSGMVEIDALAICGEVTIIVPDGAEIELDGTPILGSIEQQVHKKGVGETIREWVTGDPDEAPFPPEGPSERPFFRIEGRAILGTVKVMGR